MKSVATIDADQHIWRLKDLAWLSGPQVPHIFGRISRSAAREYGRLVIAVVGA